MSFVERLDLTPEEKQVYQLLLGCGQLTTYEIAQFSRLHYSNTTLALDGLLKKGAVGVSEGYLNKYYVKIPLEYLGETSDQLNANVRSNIDAAKEFIQNKKNGFTALRSSLVSQLEESINKKKEELDLKLSQTSSKLQTSTQNQKETVSQKTNELSSQILGIQETQNLELKQTINELLRNNIESLNQANTSINTILENVKLKNDDAIVSANSEVSQKALLSIEKIDGVAESFKPKLNELNQALANDLDGIIQQVKQNIDTTKMDVRSFNRSQADKYVGYSEETTRKTGETIEGISESVTNSLSDLNSSLELILNRKVEDMSLQVQETINTLKEKIDGIKESLLEELVQQKSTSINNTISQIKESMALRYTDLQNNEQNQRNVLISERDMFAQKLETHYNEAVDEYNAKIQELRDNSTARFNGYETNLSSQFENITTALINDLNLTIQSFKDLSGQLNSTITEDLETGSTRLKEKWSDLIEKTELLIQEGESKMTQQYQQVASLIQTTTTSVMEELNNYVQETFNATNRVTSEIINTSKNSIEEGTSQISVSLTSEVNETMTFLEDTEKKFTDTANQLIGATMKLKNDFRTLEATSKETTIPAVQTSSIIGLEAILEHISRIVGETKRGVTIMSPKPEYVPVEVIKQLPTTVKVTIVTKLDEQIDRDWINSVSSAQANVEIRKFRDTGTGAEMPQFIGVERENEEVLIAAQDEASQHIVGIISSSTYFAKLVSYIVISDYARGRSTQIK